MSARLPNERSDDLDTQFDAIAEGRRADVRRLREEVATFGRGYRGPGRWAAHELAWTRNDDGWSLSCGDDGVGSDTLRAARRRSSVGLTATRERAQLIGASPQVPASAGQGTTIRLELPPRAELC